MKQTLLKQRAAAWRKFSQRFDATYLLNRSLPANVRISLTVGWGLVILPIAIFNQIFAPHAIWMVMVVVLTGLYSLGYLWIRNQAENVVVTRNRIGPVLVAGDHLHEDFEIANHSRLPLLWAELIDRSELPTYQAGRVVSMGGDSSYRWQTDVACKRRGVFRIGPHTLTFGDPFGLYRVTIAYAYSDIVIIYPRVVEMPPLDLPLGNASGTNRRRRPLAGPFPAASVVDYRPGDSLRYIHWPMTAHRGRLTVKELEIEPSGDVWIVLDLNRLVHTGPDDEDGTFEFSIVMAASLAAELLTGPERRAVGLLTTTSKTAADISSLRTFVRTNALTSDESHALTVSPQTGSAQLWNILGTLASVEAADISLVDLLRGSRDVLGKRRTIYVISPDVSSQVGRAEPEEVRKETVQSDERKNIARVMGMNGAPDYETEDWVAELLHLRSSGLSSSVLLIDPNSAGTGSTTDETGVHDMGAERIRSILLTQDVSTRIVPVGLDLRTLITFRRTRQVIRSTPTGGVVTYDVEEDVG